jgi:hypothetical protein
MAGGDPGIGSLNTLRPGQRREKKRVPLVLPRAKQDYLAKRNVPNAVGSVPS